MAKKEIPPSIERRAVLRAGLSLAASASTLAGQGSQIHYLSLTEAARKIRNREISPVELTKSQLQRIESLDSRLNAYIQVLSDHALEQARQAESEIQAGRYRGPLHGIPIAVKDLFYTKGIATKGGLKALANFVPDYDSTAVERLEKSGAVLLGKLNLTEGAMAGYHRDFKIPRNPWAADRSPGFSSSGSGVATAAGLCYASLGTDTGGSIRHPSTANGIVGLKPTWGRVSRYGVLALAPSLDHVGPMTRRVADAAAVLGVVAGYDANDPTSLSDPVPGYLRELEKGVKGLKLGFDEAYASKGVPGYLAEAIRKSVRDLEKQGAQIVTMKMPPVDEPLMNAWMTLCSSEAVVAHQRTFPSHADDYGTAFRQILETGRANTAAAYVEANLLRADFSGKLRQTFKDIDLLACPSMASEAFQYKPEQAYEGFNPKTKTLAGAPMSFLTNSRPFTFLYNYTGYPTLSLPCGESPDGMPLSLQLVAKPLMESLLFRAGHAFENATRWHHRHPPV
jgi:amidase